MGIISASDSSIEINSDRKPIWEHKIGKFIEKSHAVTDPSYGCVPSERKIDSYINNGIINLNKPPGPTSHEVVSWVKKIFSLPKAGHSGTLDPAVTGVLPVALGAATKVLNALLGVDKEYVAIMKLHKPVLLDNLSAIVKQFKGPIFQLHPVRSSVMRRMRVGYIYMLIILEVHDTNVVLQIACQAGTYIRKLIYDIGEALGTGAHMKELRRVRTGPFSEREHHYSLYDVKDAYHYYVEEKDECELRKVIRPLEEAFKYVPKIVLRDSAVDAICHGAKLTAPGVVKFSSTIRPNQTVVMLTLKGEAVGTAVARLSAAQILHNQHGIVADTRRVIMPPGIYPPHLKNF
ncbi:MAG: RNA-guided pseudouridylation complex pseudouridine synthase subunit Cbf5 [Candidatus Ranarchaeia archaeon]